MLLVLVGAVIFLALVLSNWRRLPPVLRVAIVTLVPICGVTLVAAHAFAATAINYPAVNPLLISFLVAAGVGTQWLGYIAAAISVACFLDAVIPQPAAGSHWLPARKLLSAVAINFGHARNATQPPLTTWLLRVLGPILAKQPPAQTAPQGGVAVPPTGVTNTVPRP